MVIDNLIKLIILEDLESFENIISIFSYTALCALFHPFYMSWDLDIVCIALCKFNRLLWGLIIAPEKPVPHTEIEC